MKFCELLSIGTVVLLKEAFKKLMIIGYMPVKHTDTGEDIAYDYIGVPYPEGFIGNESALVFNHDDIEETVFQGFSNDERVVFVNIIQKIIDETYDVVNHHDDVL